MPQDAVSGHGRGVIARSLDQLANLQLDERALHRALGQSGFIGKHAQTCLDRLPALARGAAVKKQIDEKCSRLLIVADDVAHENIENVIINWNDLFRARHAVSLAAIPIIGQYFSCRCHP